MSAPATAFGIYFGIGLLLLTVAVASNKNRKRAQHLDLVSAGEELGAGYLIFIALLWPIWLLALLMKK